MKALGRLGAIAALPPSALQIPETARRRPQQQLVLVECPIRCCNAFRILEHESLCQGAGIDFPGATSEEPDRSPASSSRKPFPFGCVRSRRRRILQAERFPRHLCSKRSGSADQGDLGLGLKERARRADGAGGGAVPRALWRRSPAGRYSYCSGGGSARRFDRRAGSGRIGRRWRVPGRGRSGEGDPGFRREEMAGTGWVGNSLVRSCVAGAGFSGPRS